MARLSITSCRSAAIHRPRRLPPRPGQVGNPLGAGQRRPAFWLTGLTPFVRLSRHTLRRIRGLQHDPRSRLRSPCATRCVARYAAPMEDGTDSVWMTYRELAEALGISQLAAEARARRAKWRRLVGNQAGVSVARVEVPPGALDSLREHTRRATEPATQPRTSPAAEPATQGATEPDAFHPFFRRFAADLDHAQATLEARTRELAETREALAEQRGAVAGLREAVRVAEAAAAEAERRASQSHREALDSRERERVTIQRAESADADLARLRGRGWWARVLNRD